jgi:hypothetical protein
MYYVTVLPNGAKNLAGKSVLPLEAEQLGSAAIVRVVLPVSLVSEFDTWLANSLQPSHIERPTKAINEYNDSEGQWPQDSGLQVVYYLAVEADKLEAVEQFATEYTDTRT